MTNDKEQLEVEDKPNDWIKHLAPDYKMLEYGYRVYILRPSGRNPSTFWANIIILLKRIFG